MCIILWKTVYTIEFMWISFLIKGGQLYQYIFYTIYYIICNYFIIILMLLIAQSDVS